MLSYFYASLTHLNGVVQVVPVIAQALLWVRVLVS
jgi:hypothetical protein